MQMITNPEAIFISEEEKEDFIRIIKEEISDIIQFTEKEACFNYERCRSKDGKTENFKM